MELNVQERLTAVNLLPEKGNFETMKTIEALRSVLYPSEEEIIKFEIKQESNNIRWNAEGAKPIPFKFTKVQKDLLVAALDKLNEKEELTFAQYTLYKKFKEK
jgi:hypothetical protein